jgi:hypothetical protein
VAHEALRRAAYPFLVERGGSSFHRRSAPFGAHCQPDSLRAFWRYNHLQRFTSPRRATHALELRRITPHAVANAPAGYKLTSKSPDSLRPAAVRHPEDGGDGRIPLLCWPYYCLSHRYGQPIAGAIHRSHGGPIATAMRRVDITFRDQGCTLCFFPRRLRCVIQAYSHSETISLQRVRKEYFDPGTAQIHAIPKGRLAFHRQNLTPGASKPGWCSEKEAPLVSQPRFGRHEGRAPEALVSRSAGMMCDRFRTNRLRGNVT